MPDKEKVAQELEARIGHALARVLDHAESHGEVYDGATSDHETLRLAVKNGHLPAQYPPVD